MCGLLRKRSLSANGQLHVGQEAVVIASPCSSAPDASAPGKRQRTWTSTPRSLYAVPPLRTAHQSLLFGKPLPTEWRWVAELHAARVDPAPANLTEIVQLHHTPDETTHDMICAMEFCPDGLLLATGSMSKQVGTYNEYGIYGYGSSSLQSCL